MSHSSPLRVSRSRSPRRSLSPGARARRSRERRSRERRSRDTTPREREHRQANDERRYTSRDLESLRQDLERAHTNSKHNSKANFDLAFTKKQAELQQAQADLIQAQAKIAALEQQLAAQVQAQMPVQVTVPTAPPNPAVQYVAQAPAVQHIAPAPTTGTNNTHPLVGTYLLPGTGPTAWKPVDRQTKGKDPIWIHASHPTIDWACGKHWHNRPYYMVDDQSIRCYPVVHDRTSANIVLQVSADELWTSFTRRVRPKM